MGDLIDFLGDDPDTKSILLYMEGMGSAKKFMSAARGFARNKPIIVLKPGRFAESAKAALSHTGAMAGDDQVYDAAEVLHSRNLPKGPGIAIVTNAGGAAVIATDSVIELGGRLASLSEESLKTLDAQLPKHWSKGNPVDVLGDADIDRYLTAINTCLNDREVHGVIIIYTPQGATRPGELAKAIAGIAQKAFKPIITVWMGGREVEGAREIFQRPIR